MENFTVFFNGRLDRPMELMFNGEVLPTEKTPADDFPFLYGPLRMRFHDLNLGRFRNTEKVIREFPVYNAGEVPLKLRSGADKPYLDAYLQPDDLLPGMEGRLSITYNAAGNPGYGPMPDTLPLYSGRTGELVISIPLTMYQEEDFSKLNEAQVDVAPRVAFTNTSHDFGVVRAGDEATHTFEISNKGKRQLVVRNVVSSSPFLQYHLESNKIRFNQKVSLKVYFSAVDKPGPFLEQLTLICNDPSRPEVNVYVQGAVVRQ